MSDLLLGTPNDPNLIIDGQPAFVLNDSGDLQFDKNGLLVLTKDKALLEQNIGKILLTAQGSSAIDPSYGTTLNTFVGTSLSTDANYALMRQTILDAMGYLVNKYINSTNPKEQIATVETISVKLDPTQGSKITVQLVVSSVAGEIITSQVTV